MMVGAIRSTLAARASEYCAFRIQLQVSDELRGRSGHCCSSLDAVLESSDSRPPKKLRVHSAAKALIDHGYIVNVERSPARIFKDEEFEAAGAKLVPEGSWVSQPL